MGVRLDKGLEASNSSSSREVEAGEVNSSSRQGEGAFSSREASGSRELLISRFLHCILAAGVQSWNGAFYLGALYIWLRTWNENLCQGTFALTVYLSVGNNVSSSLVIGLKYHMKVHYILPDYQSKCS